MPSLSLLTFFIGGTFFLLIGFQQSLSITHQIPFLNHTPFLLSVLSLVSSLVSLSSALLQHDPIGIPLSISTLLISSLFLLYSLSSRLRLPPSAVDLVLLAAFLQEGFYLRVSQRVNPTGVENRYLDLLVVPVGVCAVATAIRVFYLKKVYPVVARGVALVLHGTWLIQMGFSFFSSAITSGCVLHQRSLGNYTIICKGHHEYHRSSAISTLQFNCHLAFLVVLVSGIYSGVSRMTGAAGRGADYSKYRPLHVMQGSDGFRDSPQFVLESDNDEDERKGPESAGEITMEAVGNLSRDGGINGSRGPH